MQTVGDAIKIIRVNEFSKLKSGGRYALCIPGQGTLFGTDDCKTYTRLGVLIPPPGKNVNRTDNEDQTITYTLYFGNGDNSLKKLRYLFDDKGQIICKLNDDDTRGDIIKYIKFYEVTSGGKRKSKSKRSTKKRVKKHNKTHSKK